MRFSHSESTHGEYFTLLVSLKHAHEPRKFLSVSIVVIFFYGFLASFFLRGWFLVSV